MSQIEKQTQPSLINWKTLAMWFGRLLLAIAVWIGQQMLQEVKEMTTMQREQIVAVQRLDDSVKQVSRELSLKTQSRWTQVDMKLWAVLLSQRNPTLVVPEPLHTELPGEVR